MTHPTNDDASGVPIDPRRYNVDPEAVLNANWAWSDSVTSFVASRIEGRSLKALCGLTPICDVNLDLLPLQSVVEEYDEAAYTIDDSGRINPDDEAHDAIGGRFAQGDAFNLPFADAFQTVVSDPPWKSQSIVDRRQLFQQCLKASKVGGKILYNATWIPAEEKARLRESRPRQQADFWGNPSFLLEYRRTPDGYELSDHYDYTVDSHPRAIVMSKGVNPEAITNPFAVDPNEGEYHCPKCGTTQLRQLGEAENPHDIYAIDLYECVQCGFRISEHELEIQVDHIEKAGVGCWDEWQQFLRSYGIDDWMSHRHRVDTIVNHGGNRLEPHQDSREQISSD